jgi:hypothetical protein
VRRPPLDTWIYTETESQADRFRSSQVNRYVDR